MPSLEENTKIYVDSNTLNIGNFENILPINNKKDEKCFNILTKNTNIKVKKSKSKKLKPKKNVPKKENILIKRWGIINLAECLQESGICVERLKNHKICNKKASYVIKNSEIIENETKYLCTRHYKSLTPKMQKKFKAIKKLIVKKFHY